MVFANDLAIFLLDKGMEHSRGRPLHPQIKEKIVRYHRSMQNIIKLDNYFSPGQLEVKLKEFIQFYNHKRHHESINNLVPADVYYGQAEFKLRQRKLIKSKTLIARKNNNKN